MFLAAFLYGAKNFAYVLNFWNSICLVCYLRFLLLYFFLRQL